VSAKSDPSNGSAPKERRAAKAQDGPLVALLGGVGTLATEALTWMLTESGSRVLGVYATPRELREDLDSGCSEAQVLFIDADDSGYGVAVLAEVRRRHPKMAILLLCEAVTPAIVHGAIEEGVEGLVLKSDSVEEVITAFHHILEGRSWAAGIIARNADCRGADRFNRNPTFAPGAPPRLICRVDRMPERPHHGLRFCPWVPP